MSPFVATFMARGGVNAALGCVLFLLGGKEAAAFNFALAVWFAAAKLDRVGRE